MSLVVTDLVGPKEIESYLAERKRNNEPIVSMSFAYDSEDKTWLGFFIHDNGIEVAIPVAPVISLVQGPHQ